jgi:hypothetical protein
MKYTLISLLLLAGMACRTTRKYHCPLNDNIPHFKSGLSLTPLKGPIPKFEQDMDSSNKGMSVPWIATDSTNIRIYDAASPEGRWVHRDSAYWRGRVKENIPTVDPSQPHYEYEKVIVELYKLPFQYEFGSYYTYDSAGKGHSQPNLVWAQLDPGRNPLGHVDTTYVGTAHHLAWEVFEVKDSLVKSTLSDSTNYVEPAAQPFFHVRRPVKYLSYDRKEELTNVLGVWRPKEFKQQNQ